MQTEKRVIALGFFDGVHLGHGALLRRVGEKAAELGAAMANGVRVVFGSKDAVEAAKELFDTVETL